MILGQLLDGGKSRTATYFSPWFPRGGNLATFTCQVFDSAGLSGTDKFQITVQTKNREDSDNSASVPAGGGTNVIAMTPVLSETTFQVGGDFSSAVNAGFLELVRFKYELANSTGAVDPWVHFRMLPPNWSSN